MADDLRAKVLAAGGTGRDADTIEDFAAMLRTGTPKRECACPGQHGRRGATMWKCTRCGGLAYEDGPRRCT